MTEDERRELMKKLEEGAKDYVPLSVRMQGQADAILEEIRKKKKEEDE